MKSHEMRALDEAAVPRPWKNRAAIESAANHMPALIALVAACERRRLALDARRELGERSYRENPYSILDPAFKEQAASLDGAIRAAEQDLDSALTAVHTVVAPSTADPSEAASCDADSVEADTSNEVFVPTLAERSQTMIAGDLRRALRDAVGIVKRLDEPRHFAGRIEGWRELVQRSEGADPALAWRSLAREIPLSEPMKRLRAFVEEYYLVDPRDPCLVDAVRKGLTAYGTGSAADEFIRNVLESFVLQWVAPARGPKMFLTGLASDVAVLIVALEHNVR